MVADKGYHSAAGIMKPYSKVLHPSELGYREPDEDTTRRRERLERRLRISSVFSADDILEALIGGSRENGVAADGSGRDSSGACSRRFSRGLRPGEVRTAVVRRRPEERDVLDEFFRAS